VLRIAEGRGRERLGVEIRRTNENKRSDHDVRAVEGFPNTFGERDCTIPPLSFNENKQATRELVSFRDSRQRTTDRTDRQAALARGVNVHILVF
jgi:hypothetical protein